MLAEEFWQIAEGFVEFPANLKAKIILTAAPSKFPSLMKTEPYFKVITVVITVADFYFRQLSNTVLMQMQKTKRNCLDH